jgi:hypothetical protein
MRDDAAARRPTSIGRSVGPAGHRIARPRYHFRHPFRAHQAARRSARLLRKLANRAPDLNLRPASAAGREYMGHRLPDGVRNLGVRASREGVATAHLAGYPIASSSFTQQADQDSRLKSIGWEGRPPCFHFGFQSTVTQRHLPAHTVRRKLLELDHLG